LFPGKSPPYNTVVLTGTTEAQLEGVDGNPNEATVDDQTLDAEPNEPLE
jgi:hypothetical protein